MPAGCKTDLPLVKAEPINDSGSASRGPGVDMGTQCIAEKSEPLRLPDPGAVEGDSSSVALNSKTASGSPEQWD
ncbi:hypothetical protein BTVI_140188 [Pitangus sulphuratus]|nr:hypothetical protein BTVI_140188 [Pitangus sulphuratus]